VQSLPVSYFLPGSYAYSEKNVFRYPEMKHRHDRYGGHQLALKRIRRNFLPMINCWAKLIPVTGINVQQNQIKTKLVPVSI